MDPCLFFTDPEFALDAESAGYWFSQDYAQIREDISKCAGKIKPPLKTLKLKKAKVPKLPGPPVFWAYVIGAQTEMDVRSLDLDDPDICSRFIGGGGVTFHSPRPGWVGGVGAPDSEGLGTFVTASLKALAVNNVRNEPASCPQDPQPSGADDGQVSFYISDKGIRLDSGLGGDLCGSTCASGWPTLLGEGPFIRTFTKKEQADLKNKRKGVLQFTLVKSLGHSLNDSAFGACSGWGDGGPGYACEWAGSWSVTIILVRADTMDFLKP